ncbi:oocyst wall protein 9 [Cryptosporidium ubiquitum]|uniref:Oocyst wall protein 9 n=1 Tax=Cryptosporidium ubiquitum TaxID=857276 RepID=A0A1J4MFA8_9CRYT|nr:oocyst wall protein 9 [Cryptosporidium ubiquitum]OII72920.1 oocyst wall protein 9 [Cryptosporidium ubiquitum]
MFQFELIIVLLIALNSINTSQCNSSSHLRKLSIQVGGTSYTDGGSIPSFRPISNSNIYSAQKLPSSFGKSKKNQQSTDNLSNLIENNGNIIQKSKDSFQDVPFSITHTLKLILANKIIQSNPILYPFEIEYSDISSCQCRIDFEKIKKKYMEKNNSKDSTNKDDLYEFIYYSDFNVPDLPPNCSWSDSTREILDKLFGNNLVNETNNNININNTENYAFNNNSIFSNDSNSNNNLENLNLNPQLNMHALKEFHVDNYNESENKKNEYEESIRNDDKSESENLINITNSLNETQLSNYTKEIVDDGVLLENAPPTLSSVVITSLNGLLQCIYRIPVDFTPWRKSNPKYDLEKLSNNSDYWFNYTALNSDIWKEVDFSGNHSRIRDDENINLKNKTKFSIEGFWDLISLIPKKVLSNLNIKDENTYNLCKNERDDLELMLIDELIKNLNISREEYMLPTFSLLNIQPYNLTYCSRPTGAELDIIGICPSNGLNSVYDYETKSCISITYTDSVAFCPLNYVHSKLWGSHRGGGGCHVKQRKYLPSIPKCDPPFVYNKPRETCVIETFAPGFPGCVEGSVYYDLQTCIMAYQVMKEYECPEGYTADLEVDFFKKDISDVDYRKEILNEASENFKKYYHPNIQEDPILTRKVNDSESGIQSKSITRKFQNFKKKVKCFKKEIDEVKYNGIGAPYCQNSTFSLRYDYNNSWMFEKGPRPYCKYQDIIMVDYKCPKGTISYDSYISNGNDPPIVYRQEFVNPFDTCIQIMKVPIQPKCTTKEEIPFISLREPLNYFEKTGIHIVTKEDIENIDKESLYNPSEVIDNSLPNPDRLFPDSVEEMELENIDSDILNETELNIEKNETITPSFGNTKKDLITEFIALNQFSKIEPSITSNDSKSENGENVIGRKLIEDFEKINFIDENHHKNKKLQIEPISLYNAIIGKTDYVIKIICLKVVTAKPYLSCPENTVLVPTNMCKMKGYTDFTIECPKGYKLDEEALLLLPPEHFKKAPPRCVSKQSVFTHYYCPPKFPENVFRPFEYNITKLFSLIIEKMENKTQPENNQTGEIYPNNSTLLNNLYGTSINNGNDTTINGETVKFGIKNEDLNINDTIGDGSDANFDHFNTSNFKIENIERYNITNTRIFSMKSFGRTVVPSYSQKMCHEVELIKPLWTMPLLLRIFLNNINLDNSFEKKNTK